MAARTLPGNLGLSGDWDLGEDNWKDAMDANLRILSAMAQGSVLSIVAAEPGAPAEGDIHILDETHATHPNAVAVYDEAAWVYIPPQTGMTLYNLDDDERYQFNGSEWEVFSSGGVTALSGLSDVDLTGLADGDALVWDNGAGMWVPGAGGGGGGGGALEWVARVVVGVAQATVTFNAIAADGEDLIISVFGRGTNASTSVDLRMRFNGDTGNNYYSDNVNRFGHAEIAGGAYQNIGAMTGSTAPAGSFGTAVIEIPNYKGTTGHKNVNAVSGVRVTNGAGGTVAVHASGSWANTAAVNQIDLFPSAGNWEVGTVINLWKRVAVAGGGGATGLPWYFDPPTASQLTAISHDATMPTMVDDADVGLIINFGGCVAGDKTRAVYKAITTPAADWTFEARMLWGVRPVNFIYGGLFVQDSATGKLTTLGFLENGSIFNVSRNTSLSAGGAQIFTRVRAELWKFFRITYVDATGTMTYYVSLDGKEWRSLGNENYATSFTNKPDRVGFAITTNLADAANTPYLVIDRAVFPA